MNGLGLSELFGIQPPGVDALAHYGRLREAHARSAQLFDGTKTQDVWGQAEYDLAKQHVPYTGALGGHNIGPASPGRPGA